MRTMAQKRAEFALQKTLLAYNTVDRDKFKPFTAGASSMILQNGFGQTLAFWLAKKKNEHLTLYGIVTDWLKQTDENHFRDCNTPKDFIAKLSVMEQMDYRKNQNEALALLEWVKRFANADLA